MSRSVLQTVGTAGGFMLVGSMLAAAIFSRQTAAVGQEQNAGGTLRHVVLLEFKPEATKEQIHEIVAGFQALPKKIDGITAFEWGTNNCPEGLADGFTHWFVVTFKDAKSRDAYLPHPAHQDSWRICCRSWRRCWSSITSLRSEKGLRRGHRFAVERAAKRRGGRDEIELDKAGKIDIIAARVKVPTGGWPILT